MSVALQLAPTKIPLATAHPVQIAMVIQPEHKPALHLPPLRLARPLKPTRLLPPNPAVPQPKAPRIAEN